MTRVCLLGADDVALRYELVTHETAREALSTYDLREPYANSVAVETVSLGAAVSLLNDLDWYLVRYVEEALVLEPSVSEAEWLSRALATAIRDDEVDPAESGRYLKVYGVVDPQGDEIPADPPEAAEARAGRDAGEPDASGGERGEATGGASASGEAEGAEVTPDTTTDRPRLVEPMFLARTGRDLPSYDIREVDDTLLVRVTEAEFGG